MKKVKGYHEVSYRKPNQRMSKKEQLPDAKEELSVCDFETPRPKGFFYSLLQIGRACTCWDLNIAARCVSPTCCILC